MNEKINSIDYYEGAITGLRHEVEALQLAFKRYGEGRLWQWEELLNDYKNVLEENKKLIRDIEILTDKLKFFMSMNEGNRNE
jgi:hypothetical protein